MDRIKLKQQYLRVMRTGVITIKEAQQEIQTAFMRGFPGELVSGLVWALSAALATWYSPKARGWFLVFGGMFIFPLTILVLKALGRPGQVRLENTLGTLGFQLAMTVPITIPLAGAAADFATAGTRPGSWPNAGGARASAKPN